MSFGSEEASQRQPNQLVQTILQSGLTLLIALLGALLFLSLHLPLPYMLGALSFTIVAALVRAPIGLPGWARPSVLPLIGVMLGGFFSPTLVAQMVQWWPALVAMAIYIALATGAGVWFFHSICGFDLPTAAFAAPPGGLSEMIVQTRNTGGNEPIVAVAQSVRIAAIVFILPIVIGLVFPHRAAPAATQSLAADFNAGGLLLLIGCGLVGFVMGKALRFPNAPLLGPFLLSAIIHGVGLTEAVLPAPLLGAAQIILGATVGVRFTDMGGRQLFRTAVLSLIWTLVLLVMAAVLAYPVSRLTGWDYLPILLSLSPGGLAEMTLLTVALGIEVAFVATCHIARIFIVIVAAPFYARLIEKRASKRQGS